MSSSFKIVMETDKDFSMCRLVQYEVVEGVPLIQDILEFPTMGRFPSPTSMLSKLIRRCDTTPTIEHKIVDHLIYNPK